MRHPVIRTVGYILTGLVMLVLFFELALAIRGGHAFYGTNYKGMPLGVTYPIVALAIIAPVSLAAAIYRWRERRSRSQGRRRH